MAKNNKASALGNFSKKGAAVGKVFNPTTFKLSLNGDDSWKKAQFEFYVGSKGRAMAVYAPTGISAEAMKQVLPNGEILFVYCRDGAKTLDDVIGFLNEYIKPSLKQNAGFDIDFGRENCFDIGNVRYKGTNMHFWAWSLEENEGKDLKPDEPVDESQYVTDREELEADAETLWDVVDKLNKSGDLNADEAEYDAWTDTIQLTFKKLEWYKGFGGSRYEPEEPAGFVSYWWEDIDDDADSDMTKIMDALDPHGFGIEWKRSDIQKQKDAVEEEVRKYDDEDFSTEWKHDERCYYADACLAIPIKIIKGKSQVKEHQAAYNPDDYKADDLFIAADEYEDRLNSMDAKKYRDDCNQALKKIWDKYAKKAQESEEVGRVSERLAKITEAVGAADPKVDDPVECLKERCKAIYTAVNSRPLAECCWEYECRPLTVQDVAYLVHCALDPLSHNATFGESEKEGEFYSTDPDIYEEAQAPERDDVEEAVDACIQNILKSKPARTEIQEDGDENENAGEDGQEDENDKDDEEGIAESEMKDWAYYSNHTREAY